MLPDMPLGKISERNEKADPKSHAGEPFIGLDDIEAHTMRLVGCKDAGNLKSSAKRFYKGDVLYSRLRPYLNKVWVADRDGLCSPEFIVFHQPELVEPKFLAYRLNSSDFVAFANSLDAGDRPRVNYKQISAFNIPSINLDKQKCIVAKIEELFSELDNGIAALKTAREQLKVYRQAILKHAFEGKLTAQWREENKDKLETPEQLLARIQREREARYQQQLEEWKQAITEWEVKGKEEKRPSKPRKPEGHGAEPQGSLPEGWAWSSVGNFNVDIFDGPFGSNLKTSDYVDSGVRVIRLENIGYSEFIEDKHSYITEEKYQSLRRHTVRAGDLIFSSFITDGIRLSVLPDSIERAINKADCFCIRVHGQTIRNDYLAAYLSSRSAYKQIEDEIHGVGRPRINTTQLKSFHIPLCGRDEQDEIVKGIESALSLSDHLQFSLEQELNRTDVLRQSILKKAFSGQLVPQDPGTETAANTERAGVS